MKDIFKDLMETEGVCGAIVLNIDGNIIASRYAQQHNDAKSAVETYDWESFLQEWGESQEVDFVFDKKRLCLRRVKERFLLVVIEGVASISMVRLNCEVLLPELENINSGSRFGRLLKKKLF